MQIVITLLIFLIIASILLSLGIWLTRSGIRGIKSARASMYWPATLGKMVMSTVREEKPLEVRFEDERPRPEYRAILQYTYSIGGKNYVGNHRMPNDDLIAYRTPEKAKASLANYPVDKNVQVYYDPEKPQNAVLEPGKAGPAWRGLTGGILCLVLTLIPIWMAIAFLSQKLHQ